MVECGGVLVECCEECVWWSVVLRSHVSPPGVTVVRGSSHLLPFIRVVECWVVECSGVLGGGV